MRNSLRESVPSDFKKNVKKSLKESKGKNPHAFFRLEDLIDKIQFKQTGEVTKWLQKIIGKDNIGEYADAYDDVWFEDYDDTVAAAGFPVRSMSGVAVDHPNAKFVFRNGPYAWKRDVEELAEDENSAYRDEASAIVSKNASKNASKNSFELLSQEDKDFIQGLVEDSTLEDFGSEIEEYAYECLDLEEVEEANFDAWKGQLYDYAYSIDTYSDEDDEYFEESTTTSKKGLKESEDTYLRTFFKFDDMLDETGELKQVDEITDWLQELIDCNYLDSLWGVWFEDFDDTAVEAGIAVKTMPEIIAEDPDAEFGYSYGSPDTHLDLGNAVDYVEMDGCDDWVHFGIEPSDDDDYYDDDEDEYDLDIDD